MKKNNLIFGLLLLLLVGVVSAGVPTYTGVNNGVSFFNDWVGILTDTPTEALDVRGNIVSYGVNGVTVVSPSDDFQTILNDCTDAHCSFFLSEGTHVINSITTADGKGFGIYINRSNVSITCDSGAIISKDPSLNASVLIGESASSNENVVINGCNFECNYVDAVYTTFGSGAYKGAGILQYSDNWELRNNKLNECGPYGAVVWHGGNGHISGNTMTNSQSWIPGGASRQKYGSCMMVTFESATQNTISDNICLNPEGNGLFLEDNADRNTVTNWISEGAFRGVSVEHSKYNVLDNIQSYLSDDIGIHITGGEGTYLNNFIIQNSTNDGIALHDLVPEDSNNVAISNGYILNSGDNAIHCEDVNLSSILDVRIDNSVSNDIFYLNCYDYIFEGLSYSSASISSSSQKAISSTLKHDLANLDIIEEVNYIKGKTGSTMYVGRSGKWWSFLDSGKLQATSGTSDLDMNSNDIESVGAMDINNNLDVGGKIGVGIAPSSTYQANFYNTGDNRVAYFESAYATNNQTIVDVRNQLTNSEAFIRYRNDGSFFSVGIDSNDDYVIGESFGNTIANPRFKISSATNNLEITSELEVGGISGDGTGKAVCIKADGNLGTCTDAVGVTGLCTCA